MSDRDPAYFPAHQKLAELCREYVEIWDEQGPYPFDQLQFHCGMLIGQLAVIYNLSPPGGIMDMNSLFRKE